MDTCRARKALERERNLKSSQGFFTGSTAFVCALFQNDALCMWSSDDQWISWITAQLASIRGKVRRDLKQLQRAAVGLTRCLTRADVLATVNHHSGSQTRIIIYLLPFQLIYQQELPALI